MYAAYNKEFINAQEESLRLFGSEMTPEFPEYPRKAKHSPKAIKDLLVSDFSDGVATSTIQLPGMCFMLAREASYVLHQNRYQHIVTIGDVLWNDNPYYGASSDSIEDEVSKGYINNTPVNAHAWITLDSGQIVDLTILSSIAHNKNNVKDSIGMENAISVFPPGGDTSFRYKPMLTGFGYYSNVISHPILCQHSKIYAQWFRDYFMFQQFWNDPVSPWK